MLFACCCNLTQKAVDNADDLGDLMTLTVADEDECSMGRHECHVGQQCRNLIGGYECVVLCPSGFTQQDDGSCVGQWSVVWSVLWSVVWTVLCFMR